jgi:hypothetical protein
MRKRAILAGIVAGLLTMVALASPAHADHGDNWAPCNSGEICFQLAWDNFRTSDFQRDFWWGDWDHSDDLFENVPPGESTFPLVDGATGVWNRDTECNVLLWDWDPYIGLWGYQVVPQGWRGNYAANRNNAHTRC